jgi:hypothetical protein
MQMYIEGMCATKAENDFPNATLDIGTDGSCSCAAVASAQAVRLAR